MDAVRGRLLREGVRLLSLTGTAGSGKTRLAVAVAHELEPSFEQGGWFVDLAPVTDPLDVVPTIGRVLGLRIPEKSSSEMLHAHLRDRRLLLVLDNCEQVVAAGPSIAELLDVCPGVQVVATTREPFRVRWERLHPVPPLALPPADAQASPETLLAAPAVELFVERAREVHPTFGLSPQSTRAVAELCRRLDGLPLAIELAAARCRALPPEAVLARLERRLDLLVGGKRDEPTRHQTVRAALTWSHDLLSEPERVLFRRLAAFVSGCTLDGAEAVCDPTGDLGLDVLDGLASLLDKNLLKQEAERGEPRFGMLETVRAYALEVLERSGEADMIRQRHATYCLELAEAALAQLRGPDQMDWLNRLDRELPNMRAALRWSAQQAGAGNGMAAEQGLRLGGALWWYMHVRGLYAEVRELLRPLLRASASDLHDAARAMALTASAVAAWGMGDYDTARAEIEESLICLRAQRDRPGTCQALLDLGCIAISQSDSPGATASFAEASDLARQLGDEWMTAWALTFQGMLAIARGDLDGAGAHFEESARLRRRLGDTFGLAWAQHGLASVARLRGDAAAATPLYEDALATFRELGERPTVASILDGLGEVALARGALAEARARFGESLALYREMDSPRGLGISLSGFAVLAAAEGHPEQAVRLAAAATALHEAGGGAIELIRHRGSDAWLDQARGALGEAAAATAWTKGRATPPEQAIAEALATDGPRGRAAPSPTRPRSVERRAAMLLTPRECEVARLVAAGSSNRQIAEILVIGERTAETHLSNILAKLGLSTRVQLAAWAVAQGIGQVEPM